MKVINFIWIILFVSVQTYGQVRLTGEVTSYEGSKLNNPTVIIQDEDSKKQVSVDVSGSKYKSKLDNGKVYKVTFSRTGYYTKYVMIDTKGIPEGKRIHMYIDMSLIDVNTGIDSTLFDRPMGIARFRAESSDMTWDVVYSRKRMKTIESALKRAKKRPKAEKKETIVSIPNLKNPMELAAPMQGELQNFSLGKAYPQGKFKGYVYLGMLMAEIRLNANKLNHTDMRSVFESLSSGLTAADIAGMSLETYKENLSEDVNEGKITSTLNGVYKNCLDSAESKGYYQAKDLMMAGAWLEVMWRALNSYNESPSATLNKFIGEQKGQLKAIIIRLNQYSKQLSDQESSFLTDLEKILPMFTKVGKISEQIQSDENMIYDIPEDFISSMMLEIERIRSNSLR